MARSGHSYDTRTFQANLPFLFAIHDKKLGSNTFIGRVEEFAENS